MHYACCYVSRLVGHATSSRAQLLARLLVSHNSRLLSGAPGAELLLVI